METLRPRWPLVNCPSLELGSPNPASNQLPPCGRASGEEGQALWPGAGMTACALGGQWAGRPRRQAASCLCLGPQRGAYTDLEEPPGGFLAEASLALSCGTEGWVHMRVHMCVHV